MKAIVKSKPAPGLDFLDVPEPTLRPGHVKVRVRYGSICGTDAHIYRWDPFAAERIKPPRIIGHEFSGIVEEVGEGVTNLKPGDPVASESHIVCGKCKQCLNGQAHVCVNTKILGVDVDGGFAPYVVIPEANARKVPKSVPLEIACVQDPLGNAVHTVFAGPVEGQDILITGMGPIGLFALAVCKASCAKSVAVTEVSEYRLNIARKLGADVILNPSYLTSKGTLEALQDAYPEGVDGVLEMSGHPDALDLAVSMVRPGGRISLLGLYSSDFVNFRANDLIFKGVEIQCIIGRRLWDTWDRMTQLLEGGKLNLEPIITHRFPYSNFIEAMELMIGGKAGKIVFTISEQ
ncbi:MAG TPA: L-threonine 3-dehydrogenase [Fimbriimonadales bacterium]|nr:L-threonine 3-dehydrogenase [Fimbriimonadales bacterium]